MRQKSWNQIIQCLKNSTENFKSRRKPVNSKTDHLKLPSQKSKKEEKKDIKRNNVCFIGILSEEKRKGKTI